LTPEGWHTVTPRIVVRDASWRLSPPTPECVAAQRAVCSCRAMERRSPDTTLHVRLEAELRSQLEELARAEDRPLSSLVRRVLRAEAARRSEGEQSERHA
jgi:hypothetical protein